jgi:hypothetical protein
MTNAFVSAITGGMFLLTGQDAPFDPKVMNPQDDMQVAATLADPRIPWDLKKKLFRMWDQRQWPQEVIDPRDGSVWIYEAGKTPRREE